MNPDDSAPDPRTPEPQPDGSFQDPYDGMTDEEFNREVEPLVEAYERALIVRCAATGAASFPLRPLPMMWSRCSLSSTHRPGWPPITGSSLMHSRPRYC